jgi:electron transport complex protein RnfG
MNEKKKFSFKPTLILAIITAVTTILLVVMERSIQTDENVISGKLRELCVDMMGEGDFTLADGFFISGNEVELPKEIRKIIIHSETQTTAFQIITSGYNRDGLNLLIVMNEDGSVRDLAVYQNSETPGIGNKVNERDFLENFIGRSGELRVVRGTARNDNEIAAITGATRSVRGVTDAVNIAIYAYDLVFLGGYYEQEN